MVGRMGCTNLPLAGLRLLGLEVLLQFRHLICSTSLLLGLGLVAFRVLGFAVPS